MWKLGVHSGEPGLSAPQRCGACKQPTGQGLMGCPVMLAIHSESHGDSGVKKDREDPTYA